MFGWFREARTRRLAAEPRLPFWIARHALGQNLQGDVTTELRVPPAVHFAHSPRPKRTDDLVGAESGSGWEAHGVA